MLKDRGLQPASPTLNSDLRLPADDSFLNIVTYTRRSAGNARPRTGT
jgi:hypothetical protein